MSSDLERMSLLDLPQEVLALILAHFPKLADRISTFGPVSRLCLRLAYASPMPDLDFDQAPISFYSILFREDRQVDSYWPKSSEEQHLKNLERFFSTSIVLSRVTLGHVLNISIKGPIPLCLIGAFAEKFPFLERLHIGKLKPNYEFKGTYSRSFSTEVSLEQYRPFVDEEKPFLKFKHLKHLEIDCYTAPDLALPLDRLVTLKLHLSSANLFLRDPSEALLDSLSNANLSLQSLDTSFFCPLGHFSSLETLTLLVIGEVEGKKLFEELQRVKLPKLRTLCFQGSGTHQMPTLNHFASTLKCLELNGPLGFKDFPSSIVEKLILESLVLELGMVDHLKAFAGLETLRSLNLKMTAILIPVPGSHLFSFLTELSLSLFMLPPQSDPEKFIDSLGVSFPALREFRFTDKSSPTFGTDYPNFDNCILRFAPSELRTLELARFRLTPIGLASLTRLTHLTHFKFEFVPSEGMLVDDDWVLLLKPLSNLESLTLTELSSNRFSEKITLAALIEALSGKPNLSDIRLKIPLEDEIRSNKKALRKVLRWRAKLELDDTFESALDSNKF